MLQQIDDFIVALDNGLRTLTGNHREVVDPDEFPPATPLSPKDQKQSSSLMRVNHCGEVCAQALYEGQALGTSSESLKASLRNAASEERRHLSMCRARLGELDSRPSVLDPLFFAASFGLGFVTSKLGDRISLGFIEATEDEVCKHLDRHLDTLNASDTRTRAMLKKIKEDEAGHQHAAIQSGGAQFSRPIKTAMGIAAQVMTRTTLIL